MDETETQEKGEGSEEQEQETQEEQQYVDPLELLARPEVQAVLSNQVETALRERDAQEARERQREELQTLPDDELGKRVRAQMEQREAMESLFPEVQKNFYTGVVSELIKSTPELAELTAEERAAILSPSLKTDADVLRALTDAVGSKRAGKLVEEAKKKAIDEYKQAQENEALAQANQRGAPNVPSGSPGSATSDEVDPKKLWGNYYANKEAE